MAEPTQDPQITENPQPTQPTQPEIDKQVVQDDLPEKFKGKTATDIAKSYLELEKKLGSTATSTKQMKEELEQWQALGKILESDEALYKQVEAKVKQGTTVQPEAPKRDDQRIALENQIITKFEEGRGINYLEGEAKQALHKKIGQELAEMLDPGGTKPLNEIMNSIPLDRLDRYLDKAYKLATAGDKTEQARMEALIEARQNREASFGSIPSSGAKGRTRTLTPEQQKVARRMNMSEEDYIKELEAIEKE